LLCGRATVNRMVDDLVEMDEVFHALASQARRDMLGRLAAGPLTVGQLAAPLAMSLAAAAKHVQVLERAGLLHRTIDGRRHICRLEPGPLASAQAWLAFYEPFWTERLDALDDMFRTGPDNGEQ
jgi:DNA-binding transcriptional ArsR family regulator